MRKAFKDHWPEYLMEATGLGVFMISACAFTILLYHSASPVLAILPDELARRTLMGLAMGLTAIAIIYSPWGKRSGAHLNPAVTLAFLSLRKIAPSDAAFYMLSQFVGALAGVALMSVFSGHALMDPMVNYAATLPGSRGIGAALIGELVISFALMCVVLAVSNLKRMARFTGVFAGTCVAMFIILESPISGMSMNPARSVGSAILPGLWESLWIYFVAPPLGMLAAVAAYCRWNPAAACAKLHHDDKTPCIFCDYRAGQKAKSRPERFAFANHQLINQDPG